MSVQPTGSLFTSWPSGYYGMQWSGFSGGHLHVALEPAAGLLALKDPYDPVANAPYRAHDMTLWRGKYYLYYGVSPILVFLAPTGILLGWYPTEACMVAFFCSAGVAVALALLLRMRRRWFPLAPTWALTAGALVVALGNPAIRLIPQPTFYQVPVTGAFALHMGMLAMVFGALSAGRKRAWVCLAAASGLLGLSVGARPNYVLSGFALVVPWAVLTWRERKRGWLVQGLRLGVVAFGPALIFGIGLLYYNWARFGVMTEFGIKYTLGGERIPDIKLMSSNYVWPHLGDYLTAAGSWERYFPFFSPPGGAPHGALRYAPWLWLIPAALVLRGHGRDSGRAAFVWSVGIAAAANLVLLCSFFGLTDRYPTDFVPAMLVLASAGGLALAERVRTVRGAGFAGAGLAAATILLALAAWAKRFPDLAMQGPVARWANTPTAWWERWRGETPGGLRVELELPRGKEQRADTIVATGINPGDGNTFEIEYLTADRARLTFFHAGLGHLRGREFTIPSSRRIVVEMECGALLPPWTHPMFGDWSRAEYETASRQLRARVDGVEVLAGMIGCHGANPADLMIGGARGLIGRPEAERSEGWVKAVRQIPAQRPKLVTEAVTDGKPLELTCWFPADRQAGRDPLVTTGSGERFDVLYCEYVGRDQVTFGIYHRGEDLVASPVMTINPLVPHTLLVWMGSLTMRPQSERDDGGLPAQRRLAIALDGKVVLNQEQVFFPADANKVVLGANTLESEVVRGSFSGRIESAKPVDFAVLPDLGFLRQYGAVDLTVQFRKGLRGAAEPLVVTGEAGAGDFVYVRYIEGDKMVFGFDHWGVGGLVGEAVTVDTWKPNRLRISMGSLYPPDQDVGEWRTRVQVKLNETVVLDGTYACYPSARTQIRIGENVIGGSTCGPLFSGQVLRVIRPPRP